MALLIDQHHLAALHQRGALTMRDYVDGIERAYREQGLGRLQLLPRQNLWLPGANATNRGKSFKIAGAVLSGIGYAGIPLYGAGFAPGAIDLWIALFSTENGTMLAMLHGQALSHWKTGATAAVAARHMARADAAVVGMIGTGFYARTQITGLAAVRPIRELRCYSRGRAGREGFAAWVRLELPDLKVRAVETPHEAAADVDILVTVTVSRQPVFEGASLSPGTHCNFVGMHYPEAREADTVAIQRSRVVVDDCDQAWGEKGELMMPLAKGEIQRGHVVGDLGSVVAGKIAGRARPDEITAFCSGGTALEYVGACAIVYEKAKAAGIGQELDLRAPVPV